MTVDLNKNKTDVMQLPELIYFIYFAFLFGEKAIGLYEGRTDYNILLLLGLIMFLVKVAVTHHTVLEYVLIGGLLGICMIVYYNTGEKGLLLYFTMMLGMKSVSLKKVMQWATIILGSAFFVLVFLTSFGFMQDIIYVHDRRFFGQVVRHSLGYPYPNTLFTTYIVLMVLIMYLLGEQKIGDLIKVSVLMFVGAVFIYLYSCSNTGLIVSVFYLGMNFYFQSKKKVWLVDKLMTILMYPLCLVISIICPLVVKGDLFWILDKILHNRMNYANYYLTNEPITLFGTRFETPPNDNYMIDSSFLYSFLQIGIIPFILVTALMLWMIVYYVRHEKKIEMAIILSFCLLGLSDPFFFNLSYKNLLFLFVGALLYQTLEKMEPKENSFLWKKICLLSVVRRVKEGRRDILDLEDSDRIEIRLAKSAVEWLTQKTNRIAHIIVHKKNLLFCTYLLSTAAICAIVYAFSFSANVSGAVDQVEEWEYFRRVMSYGIYGGIIIAVGIIGFCLKKDHSEKNSNVNHNL